MNTTAIPRKRTVHIEVGTDARSYVSGGQRVTLVHCTIETTPHLWLNATHGKNESDRRRARQIADRHA